MPASSATVQEASPSPPPLPKESLPAAGPSTEAGPADQPITSLGEGDDEDADEWDPAEERLPGQDAPKKDKGKGKATAAAATAHGIAAGDGNAHPWQAVWSPEKNG